MLFPSRDQYERGSPQPLILSLGRPGATPYELYRRSATPMVPSFLLDSGAPDAAVPRYSFFGAGPSSVLIGRGATVEHREGERRRQLRSSPIAAIERLFNRRHLSRAPGMPPYLGGAVGYVGYDFVRQYEPLRPDDPRHILFPDFTFACYELIGAVDHRTRTLHLIFAPSADRFMLESRDKLYREGADRLAEWEARLRVGSRQDASEVHVPSLTAVPGQTRQAYMERVVRCQEYIREGDIYQANLSHRFSFDLPTADTREHRTRHIIGSAIYQRLQQVNPSPFSALASFEDLTLVSCSPERLVRLDGQTVETRPIAGTRPRGKGSSEDDRLKQELLTNEKERAEHLMLVDLERNDLGRVCEYGSVQVDEFMTVEQYSHVSHLVSNVKGTLRQDKTAFDVMRSVFPGGTITGVPKLRCMQIIDELEPVRRGVYTGSLGYVSWTGDMDFNILIRTMALSDDHGYLQVGAGIVADSDPSREYEETLHKGQAFFSALQDA